MIYAIRAVGTNYIKFGLTSKPAEQRLKELQIGCPLHLELLACGEGGKEAETWIHWRLFRAEAHYRGEWFIDCDESQKIIAEIKAQEIKPEGVPSDPTRIEYLKRHRLARVLDLGERKAGGWRG